MATTTTTGFQLPGCPFCNDSEATLTLDLNDVETITCSSCDETFTHQQARDKAAEVLARWERVCRWVEAAGQILAEA